MQLSNHKILVTGGASGIGLGLTERFVQDGNTVLICGRRQEVLDAVKAQLPGVETLACDLATEAGRLTLYDWIAAEHADLQVLVNNAGIQNWMQPGDADFYDRARVEIETNILAPVHLTQLFLQLPALHMIMNVTSGLAFVPFTKVPVYSATKAFFHSFTQSMQYLLQARGISVIEIVPPALNTDLGGKGLHDAAPPVSDFITAIFDQLVAGATTLSFGFSTQMTQAGPAERKAAFDRLNPPREA